METGRDGETILLVDDDPNVRKVIARMLERCGYRVFCAEGGIEAVEIFHRHQAQIACILLDQFMPQMNGRETLERLRAMRPDVPVILTSGGEEGPLQQPGHPRAVTRFIQKPFVMDRLQGVLRETIHPTAREEVAGA